MQIDVNTIVDKYKNKLSDVVGVNVILESQLEMLVKQNDQLRSRIEELEVALREEPDEGQEYAKVLSSEG